MSVVKGNGVGIYLFDWGIDVIIVVKSIELIVLGFIIKYVEKYVIKLIWMLIDVLGN